MAVTSATAHAQGAKGPNAKGDAGPAVTQTAPGAVVTAKEPPFWAAGVVVTTTLRSAALVLLDDSRREIGILTLREGESFGGYRLTAVEPSRVVLEHDGNVYSVPVGRPYTGPRDAGANTVRKPLFIPGPDKPALDVPYTGRDVKRPRTAPTPSGRAAENPPDTEAVRDLLERVFSNPQMQQKLEQRRPRVQEGVERTRQDNQVPTEAPAAPSASSPATSR